MRVSLKRGLQSLSSLLPLVSFWPILCASIGVIESWQSRFLLCCSLFPVVGGFISLICNTILCGFYFTAKALDLFSLGPLHCSFNTVHFGICIQTQSLFIVRRTVPHPVLHLQALIPPTANLLARRKYGQIIPSNSTKYWKLSSFKHQFGNVWVSPCPRSSAMNSKLNFP